MNNRLTPLLYLVEIILIQSCQCASESDNGKMAYDGSTTIPSKDGEVIDRDNDGGIPVDNTLEPESFCDNSEDIRFSFIERYGGEIEGGAQTLVENGTHYFIVDGKCRFYAYKLVDGGIGVVSTGTMRMTNIARLFDVMRFREWNDWVGVYCIEDVYDYPTWIWKLDGKEIVFTTCNSDQYKDYTEIEWLVDGFDDNLFDRTFAEYFDNGESWNGDIRYFLVKEESAATDALSYRDAPIWPLTSEPLDLAITEYEAALLKETDENDHLASGSEADELREIRAAFSNEEIGLKQGSSFIGIIDSQGSRYRLYHRDSLDIEDENGLLFPFLYMD